MSIQDDFTKNKKLSYYVFHKALKRFPFLSYMKDDLEQELLIALWKTLETYNPERAKLSTYYSFKAKAVVFKILSKMNKETSHEVSYDQLDFEISSVSDVFKDIDEEDTKYPNSMLYYIKPVIYKILKKREADILSLRFGINDGEQKTYKEISQLYDISSQRVQLLCKKALEKLKNKTILSYIRDNFNEGL